MLVATSVGQTSKSTGSWSGRYRPNHGKIFVDRLQTAKRGVWAQLELTDALFLTDDEALTWLLLEMRTVLYRRTLYLKRPLKKVEEK